MKLQPLHLRWWLKNSLSFCECHWKNNPPTSMENVMLGKKNTSLIIILSLELSNNYTTNVLPTYTNYQHLPTTHSCQPPTKHAESSSQPLDLLARRLLAPSRHGVGNTWSHPCRTWVSELAIPQVLALLMRKIMINMGCQGPVRAVQILRQVQTESNP